MVKRLKRTLAAVLVSLCVGALPARADTAPGAATTVETVPPDVFSSFNRAMFGFNIFFARYVVDPTADTLDRVTPAWLRKVGANFYENITEPEFILTNLVDGNLKDSVVSVGRLVVNSTVGIVGLFDVATPIGLERHQIEISDSFCNAGVSPGPYVVFPLVGSTNLLSGGLMGALLITEWYVWSIIDATLAAGDAMIDAMLGAASLRHIGEVPASSQGDQYAEQQRTYWRELRQACPLR